MVTVVLAFGNVEVAPSAIHEVVIHSGLQLQIKLGIHLLQSAPFRSTVISQDFAVLGTLSKFPEPQRVDCYYDIARDRVVLDRL